jgi:hypothetical protein
LRALLNWRCNTEIMRKRLTMRGEPQKLRRAIRSYGSCLAMRRGLTRSQESVDAYKHGLQLNASSVEGLSGLAQTYSVWAEAKMRHVFSNSSSRRSQA